MRKVVCLSVLTALIIFWFVFAIFAGSADFDTTFGSTGKVITTMGAAMSEVRKVVLQPDGKIVAVGYARDNGSSLWQFAVARYNVDGSLDQTFGGDGRIFTTIAGGNAKAIDAVIQPNGRIIVVGELEINSRTSTMVVRYNSNGSLDSNFTGDGSLAYNYNADSADNATSVVLQPDGKILVGSYTLFFLNNVPTLAFNVTRLTSAGTFDTTFGNGGKAIGDFGARTIGQVHIGLQPDGKIIAAGPGGIGATIDFAAVRFTANGGFDATFGSGGRVYTHYSGNDIAKTLAVAPDGRFFIGGSSDGPTPTALMARYTANGAVDTTFGFSGFVADRVTNGSNGIQSIAIQPNGSIVGAGRDANQILVIRYRAGGFGDPTFGTNGIRRFSFREDDSAFTLAIQPNGRLIVAGSSRFYSTEPTFAVARLLGRGTVGDYDSDGASDLAVFRPSDGTWYLNRTDAGYTEYPFGTATDRPVVGDFDGDGESDIAVFRPSNGRWYVLRSSFGYLTLQFGLPGDIPVAADFDGDYKTEIAVFRPSTGTWYYLTSLSGFGAGVQQRFGMNGDRAVPGDYDHDGKADLAVYRPSDSVWYILGSSRGFYAMRFGLSNDIAAPADFDGDSTHDIAVYRPSDGVWYILRSSDGSYQAIRFGSPGDIPQPADYDLDGRSDIAVFRSSDGVWHLLRSTEGYTSIAWGLAGDRPVATPIVE